MKFKLVWNLISLNRVPFSARSWLVPKIAEISCCESDLTWMLSIPSVGPTRQLASKALPSHAAHSGHYVLPWASWTAKPQPPERQAASKLPSELIFSTYSTGFCQLHPALSTLWPFPLFPARSSSAFEAQSSAALHHAMPGPPQHCICFSHATTPKEKIRT